MRPTLAWLMIGSIAVASAQMEAPSDVLADPDDPTWETRAPERFVARFATGEGDVEIEFFRPWSPHGVDRVYNLVRLGFFDDSRVYRVREGVFAQFGLSGAPAVDRAWYERALPDDPRKRSNRRGVVSFAMLAEPHSRTTQLFVNLRDNPDYDDQGFMPVGRVIDGMEAVDAFHAGYGEEAGGGMRGGRQGRILEEGNAHLDAEFPLLTRIEDAEILPGEVLRYPDPGGNSIRAELHMYPAVSTGPLDPSWNPDGSRLVFSMAGDLWTVDVAGGAATPLTRGPGHYFEPTWSPDGEWIAFARDLDGNLDIGLVAPDGRGQRMLTSHPHVDIQPAWGAESELLYFASARGGDFDLYRVAAHRPEERPEPLVSGRGHQIQPAVSPDGSALAFVSPVAGRIGTGGIWTLELDSGADADAALRQARLVHYEETAFRTEPAWTRDGRSIVFVSDESGSNDIAVVPATGGSRARLTVDSGGELDPAPGPEGRIAFVSNRGGPTTLHVAPAGGGRRQGWSTIRFEPLLPDGAELTIRVVDAGGAPAASRLHVMASDGRAYTPDGHFHRIISATDMPYFHADEEVTLRLPSGRVEIEARRGPEFLAAVEVVELAPGERGRVTLAPERLVDMPARGWISGDTHSHDLHQGRYGLTHEGYFRQLVAEDLHVTNALIHMDGTRLMGRWEDLTGEPHPLSTPTHVLQYAQEFRGSFGHVGLLGISEFVTPLIGGAAGTAFAADVLNADWLDAAHVQGGIGGYMHPYSANQSPAASEIALDVALGKGDFFDVVNYPYDDRVNASMYHAFLDAGFRLPATGGSDNFADVWRDAPPGSSRTYARVDGPADLPAWLEAVRRGNTFATNGPLLLFDLVPTAPDGTALPSRMAGPGEEIAVAAEEPSSFEARIEVISVAPLERVEVLVNGAVARSIDVRGRGQKFRLEERIEVPGAGWVAVMAFGPVARAVTDGYPFAHTTPVWVARGGVGYADPEAASRLAGLVRELWSIVERRDRFADEDSRARYRAAVEQAVAVYEEIASTGRPVR